MFTPNYSPGDGFSESPWPPLRNAVLGYLEQARPHTCWGTGEADVTEVLARIKDAQRELRLAVSFHAVALHALARAAAEQPGVMTYRHGRRLVTFSEVDIGTTIDRRIHGHRIAAAYCVRAAHRKSLAKINWELRQAINQPLPPDPAIQLRRRFARLPTIGRRVVNWMVVRNPHWVRRLYGTIGLTNLQSHGLNRPFWGLPPSVCTVTVAVGTIIDRVAMDRTGRPLNRKHVCLTGAADHAVIDGMALSRFAYRFVQELEPGRALNDAFVEETRRLMATQSAAGVEQPAVAESVS